MTREITIHPACACFPELPAKAFADLCASIKAIGLQQPILVNAEHAIMDGKNRHRACRQVGVEPRYQTVTVTGDPVRWVFEVNRHRLRKAGQLALAGARLATAEEGRPEKTSAIAEVMTRDNVAKSLGISKAAIDRAKFVLVHGCDELIAYLERGEISLGCAEWAAKASMAEQRIACAVDAKAVRQLAAERRLTGAQPVGPLRSIEVSAGIEELVARWPDDTPVEVLIGNLQHLADRLKKRRAV